MYHDECPECQGWGERNLSGVDCKGCGGSGEYEDFAERNDECVECGGRGVVEVRGVEVDCVKCEGQGTF
jgi:DnaJ-class molecular chaperone